MVFLKTSQHKTGFSKTGVSREIDYRENVHSVTIIVRKTGLSKRNWFLENDENDKQIRVEMCLKRP